MPDPIDPMDTRICRDESNRIVGNLTELAQRIELLSRATDDDLEKLGIARDAVVGEVAQLGIVLAMAVINLPPIATVDDADHARRVHGELISRGLREAAEQVKLLMAAVPPRHTMATRGPFLRSRLEVWEKLARLP